MLAVKVAVAVAVRLGVIDADGVGKALGSLDDDGVVDGSAPNERELVGLTDVDAEPVIVAVVERVALGVTDEETEAEADVDAV